MEKFFNDLRDWGLQEPGILGIALVGSHARGTAGPESDVDLVILVDKLSASMKDASWIGRFGAAQWVREEDWGAVKARRVQFADGKQVEFGFAAPEWAAIDPYDAGTLMVVRNGFRILYDPRNLLRNLAIAAQPNQPERHAITSCCGRYKRRVWFLPGPSGYAHRLALFLDAEFYLHDVDCLPILSEGMTSGVIPAMSLLFVSSVDFDSRHKDYVCDPQYSRFIAEDVVEWAAQRDRKMTRGNHVVCGLSLSGLAAAHTAFHHPRVFSAALCQSGSFWWLADHTILLPSTSARLWLSVGDQETDSGVAHPPSGLFQRVSQIEGVKSAARSFEACGATVHCNLYPGGHTFTAWREELVPALRWLLGNTE